MKTVQQIANDIIAREGGYVDDPDDLGGATNFGVTIGTLRRLGIDNDGDGRVTSSDVRMLTRAQARDIFVEHYFSGPRIDELPPVLHATVFDMYVNAGTNAVRILQRLLVDMGQSIVVDGQIGPQTIEACLIAQSLAPHHLADAFGIARRNYYYALADRRPKSRKYAKRQDGGKGGWITRAEEFISPRYHLTEAEHAARVASWE
ncbi:MULTISPECIES: holin-associated N-acetylmuramidase [Pacificibacter]|uniref:holin-associated N-acetylmuramidase n=1 Tax=Pacificibacter TaxID=1042323 RepID=UPI001C093C5C|nr:MULTISPECIES: holin-associated N-acetylmuramidase [Pacificibacter]MBU2935293.1 N-acetylmuramidase [Pacificibacter marinus]MDO6615447.1 holin-associated N-acetylmuramidase [Pacificibacter sp. 1_MG-2023]